MNLKTSLFNYGIFHNTIKRFKWGSFLYFIALFLSVPFMFFVENFDNLLIRVANNAAGNLLVRGDFIVIPLLLAFVVPVITAVLIFNNVHSSKQAVFVHGLPVSRLANYVSSLFSGFVLMAAPVIANGIILLIMSFLKYGQVMTSASVVYWIFLNLAILFIMFSVSSCTAFLTGNSAAHIGINILVHVLPLLCALTISLVSEVFLYGFISSENFIALKIMENTPIVWLFSTPISSASKQVNIFSSAVLWIYIIGALVLYFLGYIFYKKRRIEASGDVVAFNIFKPIFKYIITASSAVLIFAIILNMNIDAIYMYLVAAIITFIVYFAYEMLIGKTVKVFGKYKGYLGFVAFCAVFMSFFAYTSVFGYETRVPEKEDVQSATIYSGWHENPPFVSDGNFVKDVISVHNAVVENVPVTDKDLSGENRSFYVKYKLKNGKTLDRLYVVSEDVYDEALTKMYMSLEYKNLITEINEINIPNVERVNLNVSSAGYNYTMSIDSDASGLLAEIEKDIKNLSYEEMEKETNWIHLNIDFSCSLADNMRLNIFKNFTPENTGDDYYRAKHFDISINSNYKNAIRFLGENGYLEKIKTDIASSLYICTIPVSADNEEIVYKEDTGVEREFAINIDDCKKIDFPHGYDLAQIMLSEKRVEAKKGEYYYVFAFSDEARDVFPMNICSISFPKESLPDYLKEYVE